MTSLLIILAAGLVQIKAVSIWLFIVLYALVSLGSLPVVAGSTMALLVLQLATTLMRLVTSLISQVLKIQMCAQHAQLALCKLSELCAKA